MDISFDSSTMVGLVASLIALCYGLQFWDKDQSNLLDKVCRGLFNETLRSHQGLIEKVKATGVNRNSVGIEQQLHRTLRCCIDNYYTSTIVYFISGLATVSAAFCLFLIALPFFVGNVFHVGEVNMIVIAGQVALLIMFVPYLVSVLILRTSELVSRYVSWNMLQCSLAIMGIVLSVVLACTGLYFHVYQEALMLVLYHVAVCIPFLPIILAGGYVLVFWIRERMEIRRLKKVYQRYLGSR